MDKAFEALKTYDYGDSRAALMPIDDAVVASLSDRRTRKKLEKRLAEMLKADTTALAKEYVCRQLCRIGSAQSVPALAALLADKDLSHLARTALEHIPTREAIRALRRSLPRLRGLQKVGVINSLGMRRDEASVKALAALLNDSDAQVAAAAAAALGNIGTPDAGRALRQLHPNAPEAIRLVVADACLACAEHLVTVGKHSEARAIYETLAGSKRPEHIRSAVKRGISRASDRK